MSSLFFNQLTQLITVKNLQTPLGPDVEASDNIDDVTRLLMEESYLGSYNPNDRISLVKRDGTLVGALFLEDIDAGQNTVEDAMEPFSSQMQLPAETRVIDVIKLFSESKERLFFFVHDNNEIRGTFSYLDLFKPPFRLCLFAESKISSHS